MSEALQSWVVKSPPAWFALLYPIVILGGGWLASIAAGEERFKQQVQRLDGVQLDVNAIRATAYDTKSDLSLIEEHVKYLRGSVDQQDRRIGSLEADRIVYGQAEIRLRNIEAALHKR